MKPEPSTATPKKLNDGDEKPPHNQMTGWIRQYYVEIKNWYVYIF